MIIKGVLAMNEDTSKPKSNDVVEKFLRRWKEIQRTERGKARRLSHKKSTKRG